MNLTETVRRAIAGKVLYMHEPRLNEMLAFLEAFGNGDGLELAQLAAQSKLHAARTAMIPSGPNRNVAVVPVHGPISHRGSIFSYLFGGTSTEDVSQQLRQYVNDPTVGAIVLDIDSPGGDVDGVDELASEIYQARKLKPIVAVSNALCASAAYYLASQASELVASPSSLTGSIGVYTVHEDISQLLDNAGVKVNLIKFGENKAEGNPYEALSDPAREHLQEMVDTYGDAFEKAVARGRGVKQEDVHKKFGQGRVYDAKKAVKLGMADRIGTLDDVLSRHGAQRVSSGRRATMALHTIEGDLISESENGDGTVTMVFAAKDKKDTKRVDGKDCTKSCFAYHPDDEKANWKLPIESPDDDEEWEKIHIRNAISRWSQTDMPDAEEKARARDRVKAAAKKRGIEVGEDSLKDEGMLSPPSARQLEHERLMLELR